MTAAATAGTPRYGVRSAQRADPANSSAPITDALLEVLLVPTEGVEPTHPFGYQILSLARLPIPPHRPPWIVNNWRAPGQAPACFTPATPRVAAGDNYGRTQARGKLICDGNRFASGLTDGRLFERVSA